MSDTQLPTQAPIKRSIGAADPTIVYDQDKDDNVTAAIQRAANYFGRPPDLFETSQIENAIVNQQPLPHFAEDVSQPRVPEAEASHEPAED